jgi:hypothetical protein
MHSLMIYVHVIKVCSDTEMPIARILEASIPDCDHSRIRSLR